MVKALFFMGGAAIFTSMVGKTFIKFYRAAKLRQAFADQHILGKYYKGGFQNPMSRREAALILGVREQVERQKITDAHRRLMLVNHPDNGGSTYIAAKINEAKEILIK